MIKLNNKNITYVALADSNNSVKGVKEIWYADSNNSVKLVYRRKDALIEGEDYEKYHWLNGDGNAYIDTLIYDLTGKSIYCKLERNAEITDWITTRILGREGDSRFVVTYANTSYTTNITLWTQNRSYAPRFTTTEGWIRINFEDNLVETHQSSESIETYTIKSSNLSIILFGDRLSTTTVSRIYKGKIGQLTVNQAMNLIPCKLLKPVPKWLDANGIRRQVGECGMIDLVSGKFYGNVNNVGTFTVENYYERKEWLQGRNGAYIDTNYYPIVGTDVFSVHFHYDGTTRNPDGGEQDAFGVNYIDSNTRNFIRAFINKGNNLSCSYYKYTNSYPTTGIQSNEWNVDNLSINDSKFQYIANGTNYSFNNNDIKIQVCPYTLFVFKNNDQLFDQSNYLHGDISTFKITDTSSNTKMNLIPCTLTMDLPASMDANNIARTKGTSGMWDLVSDRFYGNVANSGEFKAVNLAEGVDYEVHQWLKVSVSTNVTMAALPVDSPNLYFKHKHISGINYHYFRTTGDGVDYDYYYSSDTARCSIWNLSSKTTVYINRDITEDEIVINCNSSNRYVNGYDIPIYGSTIKQISIISRNQNGFEGLISPITVDGIERYIPVKLLKSIPSTYDANGIARQAGECGMYDTVNDVFYGNVASSGTFSVSDDS